MELPLPHPRVAIIGSRKASPQGVAIASRIAGTLAKQSVVIVSGLAEGIDTAAHTAAIEVGGRTIAVLGTSLDKVYPRQNAELQNLIAMEHLVVSQFPAGYPTQPANFVLRNRTMALLSDASIIVEAGQTSGSLHQGWEALRLGRPLFIWKSVMRNPSLEWPNEMARYGAVELEDSNDVIDVLPSRNAVLELHVAA